MKVLIVEGEGTTNQDGVPDLFDLPQVTAKQADEFDLILAHMPDGKYHAVRYRFDELDRIEVKTLD